MPDSRRSASVIPHPASGMARRQVGATKDPERRDGGRRDGRPGRNAGYSHRPGAKPPSARVIDLGEHRASARPTLDAQADTEPESGTRLAQIERLRREVAAGSYRIDHLRVARAMIEASHGR